MILKPSLPLFWSHVLLNVHVRCFFFWGGGDYRFFYETGQTTVRGEQMSNGVPRTAKVEERGIIIINKSKSFQQEK